MATLLHINPVFFQFLQSRCPSNCQTQVVVKLRHTLRNPTCVSMGFRIIGPHKILGAAPGNVFHAAYRQAAAPRHEPPDGATHDALARAQRAAPPFSDNDNPWPAAVRECPNQCADEHLHYCCREHAPTDHPRWRDALVHLFHTTGTRHPRLTLIHPTRAGRPKRPG